MHTLLRNRYVRLAAAGLLALGVLAVGEVLLGQRLFASSPTVRAGSTWFTGAAWQEGTAVLQAPDFTVPDQNRHPVSLRQFRGRVVLLSFTSSVCRQQCPLIGRTVSTTERLLGPLASRTVLLNVSVDPEADTHGTVQTFAREMGWGRYRWFYLWTARRTLKKVWAAYYVYVPTPPPILKPGLSVVHLAAVVMIDQAGRMRAYLPYPFRPSQLARGVRDLLEGAA